MSRDWSNDIKDMHVKFGVNDSVRSFNREKLSQFIEFRLNFLKEELEETEQANCPEEFVDGLIDLCVVAIGTLNALDVNAWEAWDKVHRANMDKVRGVKSGRPNPFGMPDLVKPANWVGPNHKNNIGLLALLDVRDPAFALLKSTELAQKRLDENGFATVSEQIVSLTPTAMPTASAEGLGAEGAPVQTRPDTSETKAEDVAADQGIAAELAETDAATTKLAEATQDEKEFMQQVHVGLSPIPELATPSPAVFVGPTAADIKATGLV